MCVSKRNNRGTSHRCNRIQAQLTLGKLSRGYPDPGTPKAPGDNNVYNTRKWFQILYRKQLRQLLEKYTFNIIDPSRIPPELLHEPLIHPCHLDEPGYKWYLQKNYLIRFTYNSKQRLLSWHLSLRKLYQSTDSTSFFFLAHSVSWFWNCNNGRNYKCLFCKL